MSSCRERVLDLFVTKDSTNYEGQFDDSFVGPVWSVDFTDETDSECASIVNKATEWVTWCDTAVDDSGLEVGDLVRVGQVGTQGYTDYLTILEKVRVNFLRNCVQGSGNEQPPVIHAEDLYMTKGGAQDPGLTTADRDDTNKYVKFGRNSQYDATPPLSITTTIVEGGKIQLTSPQYAYRLNFAVNCTLPPNPALEFGQKADWLLENRWKLRHSLHHSSITDWRERTFFPLYKVNKWLTDSGKVAVKLDHGVKSLHWIKLMGYSVFNKRQVGFQSTHEMITDDWVALHIDEFQGDVVSNNKTANGSFAVLHVGGTADNHAGAIEFHQHDPAGLHTHYFENHQSTVRNLNMRFLDRNGGPAHFGRIHLWFKVCVQHG